MKFIGIVQEEPRRGRKPRSQNGDIALAGTAALLRALDINLHVRFGKSRLVPGPDGSRTLPKEGDSTPDFREMASCFAIQTVRKRFIAEAQAAKIKGRPRLYFVYDEDERLRTVLSEPGVFSDFSGINLLRGDNKQAFCGRNQRLLKRLYEMHPFRGGLTIGLYDGVIDTIEGYTRDGGITKAPAMVYDHLLVGLDDMLLLAALAGMKVVVPAYYFVWAEEHKPDAFAYLEAAAITPDRPCIARLVTTDIAPPTPLLPLAADLIMDARERRGITSPPNELVVRVRAMRGAGAAGGGVAYDKAPIEVIPESQFPKHLGPPLPDSAGITVSLEDDGGADEETPKAPTPFTSTSTGDPIVTAVTATPEKDDDDDKDESVLDPMPPDIELI